MKIKFLETVSGMDVFYQGRQEYDLDNTLAQYWISTGLAVYSGPPAPVEPPPAELKPKPKKKEIEDK